MKNKEAKNKMEMEKVVETQCNDRDCPIHGRLKTHGRIFEGEVIKKFPRRVAIEFERMIKSRKFERYFKGKTKLHARLSVCMESQIQMGDYIKIKECRPLSKIIHFVVIQKIRSKDIKEDKKDNKGEQGESKKWQKK